MKSSELVQHRLNNLLISRQTFNSPGAIAGWLGAMQAQDYYGAKWSIGLRIPGSADKDIDAAIANKSLVRSWSMRGTWHFMAPQDLRWMLQLVGPRMIQRCGTNLRLLQVDDAMLKKAYKVFIKALEGGKQLTRSDLVAALEQKKLPLQGLRLNFFLLCAALSGLICQGVRSGKEQTFVLVDEWLPPTAAVPRDESLARLASTYFQSHGPASLQDFVWWSGLTVTEAKKGLESVKDRLTLVVVDGSQYWMPKDMPDLKPAKDKIYLLPGFDEYIVGYKDRSAMLDAAAHKKVMGHGNGLFLPTVVADGKVVGTWKRVLTKSSANVSIELLTEVSNGRQKVISKAVESFGGFLDLATTVTIS